MHNPGPPFEKAWTHYPTAGRGVSEQLPVVRVATAAETPRLSSYTFSSDLARQANKNPALSLCRGSLMSNMHIQALDLVEGFVALHHSSTPFARSCFSAYISSPGRTSYTPYSISVSISGELDLQQYVSVIWRPLLT